MRKLTKRNTYTYLNKSLEVTTVRKLKATEVITRMMKVTNQALDQYLIKLRIIFTF